MITPIAKIADVASMAGVSNATVSRALRNLPGVSEPTRARILECARQAGYVLTPMSVTRTGGPPCRVAVVLPRIDTWFFGRALGALGARLAGYGCLLEVYVLPDPPARHAFFAAVGATGRLGGLVVVGMSLTEPERAKLAALRTAVVGLHSSLGPIRTVAPDDTTMARWAVEHLIGLGHRRIAMVSSDPGLPVPHVVPQQRTRGYRAAMAAAGIAVRSELEVCGADSAAGGREAMARLLVGRRMPTAVFVHTDEMAFGVLAALAGAGLSVPADVSVVSIDDHDLADAWRLTTVAQYIDKQAEQAAELLVRAVAERPGGRPVEPAEFTPDHPQLIIRATTAPPRGPRTRRARRLQGRGVRPEKGTQQ